MNNTNNRNIVLQGKFYPISSYLPAWIMEHLLMKFQILTTLALAAVACMPLSVQAVPVVVPTLNNNPDGTFELLASASLGDNAGIASYGFPLLGDILMIDHVSPTAAGNGSLGFQSVAFGEIRSSDGVPAIRASQDTVTPGYVVYGMGQTAGDIAANATPIPTMVAFAEQQVYGAALLIATGTWDISGQAPAIDVSSVDFAAGVFVNDTSLQVIRAIVPEPTGFLLASFFVLFIGSMIRGYRTG